MTAKFRNFTFTVHGEYGVGKSTLADSTPAPRLILDAEGGVEFTESEKTYWDPTTEEPPESNSWETCVVLVRDYSTVDKAYQWLNAGKHPFRSLSIDSVTEVQLRCLDSIVSGTQAPRTQDWGTLLRTVDRMIRQFRDLKNHPTNPVEVICLTAPSGEQLNDAHARRPYLSGQIKLRLPGYTDTVGYLYVDQGEDGRPVRRLLTQPVNGFVAKDRTGRLPIVVENPSMPKILDYIRDENGNMRPKLEEVVV